MPWFLLIEALQNRSSGIQNQKYMADMESTYFVWVLQVLAAKNLRIWKFQDGILLQEFASIATFVDDQNDSQEEFIR